MATVKLVLHKSKMFKDGTFPLVFQIIHERKKKIFYTKYRIKEDNLNKIAGKIHSSPKSPLPQKSVRSINRDIKQQKKLITERIEKLEHLGVKYSVNDIANTPSQCHNLYLIQYIHTLVNNKLLENKEGTASAYRNTLMSLNKFLDGRDVRTTSVTPYFARNYKNYLTHNKVSTNTISFYMRNLKTLFNGLINDGSYPEENPFKGTRTTISKTVKRALERDDLVQLLELTFNVKTESHLEFARDIFMFSYYTRGMSLVDIIYLKKSQIINDVIIYSRKKSKQLMKVKVTDSIQELMIKYKNDSEYVLPILNVNSSRSLYAQYRLALGRINHNLKAVGVYAHLPVSLTSYMARHSWATQAKETGIPIAVISEGLGHTSEKITQIYLKEFDSSIIDNVNEIVTKLK